MLRHPPGDAAAGGDADLPRLVAVSPSATFDHRSPVTGSTRNRLARSACITLLALFTTRSISDLDAGAEGHVGREVEVLAEVPQRPLDDAALVDVGLVADVRLAEPLGDDA